MLTNHERRACNLSYNALLTRNLVEKGSSKAPVEMEGFSLSLLTLLIDHLNAPVETKGLVSGLIPRMMIRKINSGQLTNHHLGARAPLPFLSKPVSELEL